MSLGLSRVLFRFLDAREDIEGDPALCNRFDCSSEACPTKRTNPIHTTNQARSFGGDDGVAPANHGCDPFHDLPPFVTLLSVL